MNQTKAFRILELIWLFIGIAGIAGAIYMAIQKDNNGILYFLGITVIAGIFYALRRSQRIKSEGGTRK